MWLWNDQIKSHSSERRRSFAPRKGLGFELPLLSREDNRNGQVLFEEYPEILTVNDLAKALQLSRSQIYDLTRRRGQIRQDHPLPILRIATNLRFRKRDVIEWLDKLSQN